MDNVPSSAILAIVAIVAACILGAFIFTTVQSQKEAGNQAVNKTEEMNTALDESMYTQYDGATVTGSQVLAAIKLMKNDGIVVAVDNGMEVTYYLNTFATGYASVAGDLGIRTFSHGALDDKHTGSIEKKVANVDKSGDRGMNAATKPGTRETYSTLIRLAKDKSAADSYITPSAQFMGGVIRDFQNGSIIGVTFIKQP